MQPMHCEKSAYNYVVYDSAGVEKSFAQQLDQREEAGKRIYEDSLAQTGMAEWVIQKN